MKEGNSKKTALEEKYKVRMQELSVSLKISITVQWDQMKLAYVVLFFYGFAPSSFLYFLQSMFFFI